MNHNTGTLIGISDMLSRGENLMKPEVNAGFAPEKPILVLHGSGDKVSYSTGLIALFFGPDCVIGHGPQRIQKICR